MTKLEFARKAVSTIVGIGITKIVNGIIENNVPTDTKTSKVTVHAASAVIGYAASDAASEYTDAKIDEIVNWWQNRHNTDAE